MLKLEGAVTMIFLSFIKDLDNSESMNSFSASVLFISKDKSLGYSILRQAQHTNKEMNHRCDIVLPLTPAGH